MNGEWTVDDAHGNYQSAPSIDVDVGGTADLREISVNVTGSADPVTQIVRVAFSRNLTSSDLFDESPAVGQVNVLYGMGSSVAGQG